MLAELAWVLLAMLILVSLPKIFQLGVLILVALCALACVGVFIHAAFTFKRD